MNGIISMLSDGTNNTISSKRVVTILAFILCGVAFISDLFWGFKVEKASFDAMMYIVIAGLGFTASEKFTNKKEILS